jgi:hypothetical protein
MNSKCAAMSRGLKERVPKLGVLLCLLLFSSAFGSNAATNAVGDWVTYVDPSLISGITYYEGELYMATSGGVLIYNVSDSTFYSITNTSGLPSNLLTCLAFNKTGELYVGTSDAGMAKLVLHPGGATITTFNATFQGLSDDRVTSVAAWGDTIIYGTEAGAGIIVKDFPLVRYYQRDGLPDERVNNLFADGDRVWIATKGGVGVLTRDGFIHDFSSGLPDVNVHSLTKMDTAVVAGTFNGVAQFNPSDSTWMSIGLGGKKIYSLFFDGTELWAGSIDSVYAYDGVSWRGVSLIPYFQKYQISWFNYGEIRSIYRVPDSTVYIGLGDWVSERRGCNLVAFDGVDSWKNIVPNAPAKNYLIRLAVDVDGSIWFSSDNFGVGKMTSDGVWVNYNNTTPGGVNLSSRFQNNGLLVDRDGTKWISGINGPIDELHDQLDADYSNDVWIHHAKDSGGGDGMATLRTERALEDPAGNRWFLSDAFHQGLDPSEWGIQILSQDTTEWLRVNPVSTGGGMKEGDIRDIAFGPDGVAYVAVLEYGVQAWFTGGYDKSDLFNLADDAWISIGTIGDDFSSTAKIYSLELQSDGALWIGTSVGLYMYKNGAFTFMGANRGFGVGLLGAQVSDLALDKDENLWVATDYGLNRITKGDVGDILSFTTPSAWQQDLSPYFPLDVVSPLANASCTSLALDRERNILYIGTIGGLSALDLASLNPQATDMSKVYLYPNPIRTSLGDNSLKIANINSPVMVEVYNVEGELVNRQQAQAANDVVWDLTTPEGFIAASGVYFVRVLSESRSIVKTISLIR